MFIVKNLFQVCIKMQLALCVISSVGCFGMHDTSSQSSSSSTKVRRLETIDFYEARTRLKKYVQENVEDALKREKLLQQQKKSQLKPTQATQTKLSQEPKPAPSKTSSNKGCTTDTLHTCLHTICTYCTPTPTHRCVIL